MNSRSNNFFMSHRFILRCTRDSGCSAISPFIPRIPQWFVRDESHIMDIFLDTGLLASSGLHSAGRQFVTVTVCLYLRRLVTWDQNERPWCLIYRGGFVWAATIANISNITALSSAGFLLIKMRRGKNKMLITNLFKIEKGEFDYSFLTKADTWVDFWC